MASFEIEYDNTRANSKGVFLAISLTCVVLFVIFIFSYYFFLAELTIDQNRKQETVGHFAGSELDRAQEANLEKLRWIDKPSGKVSLPIDVAKAHVVKTYN